MKLISKTATLSLMFFLLLTSCEKDLDTRKLDFKQQIVVNALFDQNSAMKIFIGLSKDDPFFKPIQARDASVLLFENGLISDSLNYQEYDSINELGFFRTRQSSSQGNSYSIVVNVPGFPVCSASTTQPFVASPANLLYQPDTSDGTLRVSFSLNDLPDNGHFYRIRTYIKNTFIYPDSLAGGLDTSSLRDYGVISLSDQLFNRSGYYLSDEGWNGQNRTFFAQIPLKSYPESDGRELVAEVINCSKEFFTYQYDLFRYFATIYDLNDPVFVRSNIANGLGVFAGSASAYISIPLP